ncbi:MAG: hypothetical protein M3137_01195 [Actinomycetota bacterium]|nr:hypothetical protein [Actinomycetota bacterium]
MSVPPVAGPYLAAVLVLGGAGLFKVSRPHDTAVALRRAGVRLRLTRTKAVVRLGAAAEVAVAGTALVASGPVPAAVVAASYLGFVVFIVAALVRHWPLSSCGCFGRPDTAPTAGHVVVNSAAVVAAIWWAVVSDQAIPTSLRLWRGPGVPVVFGLLVASLVVYVVVTSPRTKGHHRRVAAAGTALEVTQGGPSPRPPRPLVVPGRRRGRGTDR